MGVVSIFRLNILKVAEKFTYYRSARECVDFSTAINLQRDTNLLSLDIL